MPTTCWNSVPPKETNMLSMRNSSILTFYLSIILDLQNFFHWYILQSWKLKRPPIQLRPHHFLTYTNVLKQQWTIEEISIFSNSSHLEWRTGLSETILKGTHPGTIINQTELKF
jgi:hypothetical protein